MNRRAAVAVLASVAVLGAGCNDSALPSGPPQPARSPRPPRDELDHALASTTDPAGVVLRAWRDQINGAVA